MAKKAKKAAGQPSIMDQFAAYQPPWNDADEIEEKKAGAGEDQVKSLTEQLAKMQAKLDGFERQDAYRSFQQNPAIPAVAQQSTARPKTTVDLTGMPDPVSDTEKWQAEMAKRINDATDARLAAVQAEQAVEMEKANLSQNLWNGFKTAHPDWASHEMLIEAAAAKVSQGMLAKGVNVVAVMKQQPDLFYGEVAGLLDKQYPQLKGKAGDDEEEDEAPAEVFGGQGGAAKGLAGEVQGARSLEEDNRAWLRELGEARIKAGLR